VVGLRDQGAASAWGQKHRQWGRSHPHLANQDNGLDAARWPRPATQYAMARRACVPMCSSENGPWKSVG
jgi:hypothetical protein